MWRSRHSGPRPTVAPGDSFLVAGLGVAVRGDGKSGGTARAASLVATGRPGNLQIRLVDAATMGEKDGLGACTGDSGAPVFANGAIIGVVSWSTGPRNSAGCGGLTGVTPSRPVSLLGHRFRKTTWEQTLTLPSAR